MLEENLKKLGFSDNLSKIYLRLLALGKAKARGLINETGLQRSVIYAGLEELIGRELVTKTISKGVALYRANDPEAFLLEVEKRKLLAETVINDLKNKHGVAEREVLIYEGEDIIKRIAEKSLQTKPDNTVYF